ncbi:MAG TPA: S41 family peptidase [Bryobacteraceae bacterium]|nr:S41 family peptidase [Bryobacteraceae bacterium]
MLAGRILTIWLSLASVLVALSPEQRIHDFQNLAALYAKRYAPYEWKRQLSGFDLMDIASWLDRVRAAKDDLEFYEICAEYVARLDDLHSWYRVPSSFTADLNFTVDIYDNKVLIDSVNRQMLPVSEYPFEIGDELVSVDGKTVEELITEFGRFRQRGNPLTTRRGNADLITFRQQSVIPRAVELGETAAVEIRRANRDLQIFAIPWTKTGVPLTSVGPVPSPRTTARSSESMAAEPEYMRPLVEMRNWSLPQDDHLLQGTTWSEEAQAEVPRRYVLGYGSARPVFRSGFPSNFVQRLGNSPTDFHFTGTYQSEGVRIGYIRFRNFSPNMQLAIQELEREVQFFEQNTDGVVVDVMRNTGGGCYMLDAAARLIPYPFYFFGEEIRATLDRLNSLQFAIEAARRARAEQWIIDTYSFYLEQLTQAYRENRGRTGAIPGCTQFLSTAPATSENHPRPVVYTKPMIILVDEFSTSAGDIFPSMLQDNKRGPLVGTRTNGAGGSVSLWSAGLYSEASSSNTNTLVVRKEPITADGYPTAPYIENTGAHADVRLDYMSRENLMSGGRQFVEAFTRVLVEHVKTAGK